ncbi:hypothetical protein VTO42DRAFT_5326 [Malbranchea cinnamomea]
MMFVAQDVWEAAWPEINQHLPLQFQWQGTDDKLCRIGESEGRLMHEIPAVLHQPFVSSDAHHGLTKKMGKRKRNFSPQREEIPNRRNGSRNASATSVCEGWSDSTWLRRIIDDRSSVMRHPFAPSSCTSSNWCRWCRFFPALFSSPSQSLIMILRSTRRPQLRFCF